MTCAGKCGPAFSLAWSKLLWSSAQERRDAGARLLSVFVSDGKENGNESRQPRSDVGAVALSYGQRAKSGEVTTI